MTREIRLSDLRARIEEVGECWVWQGYASQGKFPQWRLDGVLKPTRRIVWELVHGPLEPGMQVAADPQCCPCCVHPDHLQARTRSKALKGMHIAPDRKANIARSRRARSTLMTMEIARAIRASDEPGPVVEARYGLKKGYASRIRLNVVWKDHASPFARLGALR